jgi:hypothetical protein
MKGEYPIHRLICSSLAGNAVNRFSPWIFISHVWTFFNEPWINYLFGFISFYRMSCNFKWESSCKYCKRSCSLYQVLLVNPKRLCQLAPIVLRDSFQHMMSESVSIGDWSTTYTVIVERFSAKQQMTNATPLIWWVLFVSSFYSIRQRLPQMYGIASNSSRTVGRKLQKYKPTYA